MARMKSLMFVVAISGVLLLSQNAFAQPGRGGPGGGPGGPGGGFNDSIRLLGSEGIQDELELSDDQKEELVELRDETRKMMEEMFSGFRDIPREERREKMEELREEMQEKMKALGEKADTILLEPQKQRLSQIRNQMSGRRQRGGQSSGMITDEIAEKLGLSEEQMEKIRETAEEAQTKMREKMAEMQKEAQDSILKVLDADQRKQYEEMFGAPFDMTAAFQRRGGGDRGDRGGDRGDRGGDRGDRGRDRGGDRPEADASDE